MGVKLGTGLASTIQTARKTITFTGASGFGLAGTACQIFTVTGDVLIHAIIPKCTVDLTEAAPTATVSLGTASQVARFIAATTSTAIDANEVWFTTTPTLGSLDLPDGLQSVVIVNSDNIIVQPATQNTNGGAIAFVVFWEAVSTDGSVVAA